MVVLSLQFWDLRPWPEGSYELGSVRPSVLLSFHPSVRKFSWDWFIIFFTETQHGVRGPCIVVRDRFEFFEKKLFAPKKGEIGQKNCFLNFFGNFVLFFFFFFCIWTIKKGYIFAVFLHKSLTSEKFGSWDMGQNALDQSECSIF